MPRWRGCVCKELEGHVNGFADVGMQRCVCSGGIGDPKLLLTPRHAVEGWGGCGGEEVIVGYTPTENAAATVL